MSPARPLLILCAVLAGAILAPAACDDGPPLQLCGEIPAGGCPLGRGGTCEDATCAGLYDCVAGRWTLNKTCPGGSSSSSGSAGGLDAGPDGPCTPVTVSHAGETSDCMPDLQNPDCPAAAAEACAESVCLTGCTDFFLCTAPGWTLVAYCDDQGQIVVKP